MYENDPNRMNRPRVGDPVGPGDGTRFLIGGIAIAAIIAFAIFLWPRDATGPSLTQSTPGVERTTPSTPPANKPVMPAPAPVTPQ